MVASNLRRVLHSCPCWWEGGGSAGRRQVVLRYEKVELLLCPVGKVLTQYARPLTSATLRSLAYAVSGAGREGQRGTFSANPVARGIRHYYSLLFSQAKQCANQWLLTFQPASALRPRLRPPPPASRRRTGTPRQELPRPRDGFAASMASATKLENLAGWTTTSLLGSNE